MFQAKKAFFRNFVENFSERGRGGSEVKNTSLSHMKEFFILIHHFLQNIKIQFLAQDIRV